MATLPSNSSLTGATTTNAQQKTNFSAMLTFLSDLLGTDSSNKAAARAALGVPASTDFVASLGNPGSYTFPNGFILKWGTVVTNASGVGTVTFAAAFPNVCIVNYATLQTSGISGVCVGSDTGSATGMNAFAAFSSNGAAAGSTTLKWLAFGR
jgi:hypothetical protein